MSKWKHDNGRVIDAVPGSFRETLCEGSAEWAQVLDGLGNEVGYVDVAPAKSPGAEEPPQPSRRRGRQRPSD